MLEGMSLSQSANSPSVTIGDLLRLNVLRHLMSKALQGDAEAAAAALQPVSARPGAKGRQPTEALLVEDGHGQLQEALAEVLSQCNFPVTASQVNELLLRAGPQTLPLPQPPAPRRWGAPGDPPFGSYAGR
ncbi:DEAH-box RNA/DNA helicase, putative [Eimeria tenella]|uniref:DEAH-box RNA/DNA helicase, putative n=1 Tax=Eimeria tenella TaxID=5802 RepID=U6KSR5_EIMTE|nr:DEAH-box RNA/DNA helicase, putative [Eimeria tenella]CDJ38468.1 DEAH-box RNA/DNA helicase, putative [Eimeria tenella]|eukprot:XP_013229306.1 DEAH-box RNA/DNA helicase, putative [Eimeria tenella]